MVDLKPSRLLLACPSCPPPARLLRLLQGHGLCQVCYGKHLHGCGNTRLFRPRDGQGMAAQDFEQHWRSRESCVARQTGMIALLTGGAWEFSSSSSWRESHHSSLHTHFRRSLRLRGGSKLGSVGAPCADVLFASIKVVQGL